MCKPGFNSRNNMVLAIGAAAPPAATRRVMEFLIRLLYSFGFSISGTSPSCPNMPLLFPRGTTEDFPVIIFVIGGGPESWPISSCGADDIVISDNIESESLEGLFFEPPSLKPFSVWLVAIVVYVACSRLYIFQIRKYWCAFVVLSTSDISYPTSFSRSSP